MSNSPGASQAPTPYAVLCVEHGRVYLTPRNYDSQMRKADDLWRCPICGSASEWDDLNYEQRMGYEV